MTRTLRFYLPVLLLLCSIQVLAAPRVALLRQTDGTVQVSGKPAKKLQALRVGDSLELVKGATITVDFLKSGLRQSVTGPAKLTVDAQGLKGDAKIQNQPKARMGALADIGAQKKMGGTAVRAGVGATEELRVSLAAGVTGPTFKVLAAGKPYTGKYYAVVQCPTNLDFEVWEEVDLSGSEFSLPAALLQRLEPGVTYSVLVGRPEEFSDYGGHELRFQHLPEAEFSALSDAQKALQDEAQQHKNAEPLVLLMQLLDDNDLVEAAARAGRQALSLGGLAPDEQKLVAEAVVRLFHEANDTASAEQVEKAYLNS